MNRPSPTVIRFLLRWLERGLLLIGASLAVWCAVVLAEARYYSGMPIPPPAPAASPAAARARVVPSGGWVARLDAPTVQLSATVLEGTSDATLRRASGHIEDTATPGDAGNFGIAGHRDTTFRPVRLLRAGDPLVVTTTDGVYQYRVTGTRIVNPEDVYVLDPTPHPTLTLVTCYPFEFIGHAPQRFIIHADLVGIEKR
jgi:sortase A